MKHKQVTFKVAKVIKEAGYPQDYRTDIYYSNESEDASGYGYQEGDEISYDTAHKNQIEAIAAPTYLDVWLWLWREKRIGFNINVINNNWGYFHHKINGCHNEIEFADPEDAIIAAIEYLVDNDLIK